MGKVWIQLFFLKVWIKISADFSLVLVWQPVWEKENSELKPVKHYLEINLVARLDRSEVFVYIYI